MVSRAIAGIRRAEEELEATDFTTQPAPEPPFRIKQLGSRLDRLLTLLMKLMGEQELLRGGYYEAILPQLLPVYLLLARKGLQTQLQNVRAALSQAKGLTAERDLSSTRFICLRIDEDPFKNELHVGVTAHANSYSLISDTLLRFTLHLSEFPPQL
jgi:hypothetical protein